MAHNQHDRLYYKNTLVRLEQETIAVCGAGALGSNIVDRLARIGAAYMIVIDNDRVETGNINNQIYTRDHVANYKVNALVSHCYSINPGLYVISSRDRLDERNARKALNMATLVIDTFDNAESRMVVHEACFFSLHVPCLHVGLHTDYGAARWANDRYSVTDPAGAEVCDYPLASPLVMIMAGVASQIVMHYLKTGVMLDRAVTLQDLKVFDPDDFGGE